MKKKRRGEGDKKFKKRKKRERRGSVEREGLDQRNGNGGRISTKFSCFRKDALNAAH